MSEVKRFSGKILIYGTTLLYPPEYRDTTGEHAASYDYKPPKKKKKGA